MDRSSRWLIAAVAFAAGWLGHAVFGARPLDSGAANRLLDDGWPGIAPGWWFDRFFGVDALTARWSRSSIGWFPWRCSG